MPEEKREFKRFVSLLGLFIAPFVILLGVPLLVLHTSGELKSAEEVIRDQLQRPVLYGDAYSDVTPYYKLHSAAVRKPEVLVLGASTVMQFSSRLFIRPETFFNAGGATGKMSDFAEFMSLLPADAKPKILVIGIPQFYFKHAPPVLEDDRPLTAESRGEEKFFSTWQKVWQDLFSGKISVRDIWNSHNAIGLQAIMKDNGFFTDGSYSWGSYVGEERAGTLAQSQSRVHAAEFSAFVQGNSEYEGGGAQPDADTLRTLDSFLADMHVQGVHVVGFLPPSFSHQEYETLKDPALNAGYIFALQKDLQPIFARYGDTFFDFSDNVSFGSSDAELYDSNHATRKAYARLLTVMAQNDTVLKKEVDVPFLKEKLRQSTSTLDIF